jgi:hypothetical protein
MPIGAVATPFTDEAPLRAHLGHDEHLLWSGRPPQGIRLRPADAIMVPFSLMWGGFAFFWEWMVVRSDAPLFMKLWGIPFVLVGLYLIAGRFFWDAYQRTKTCYGLTDQRVLIVQQGRTAKVKSLGLATLGEMTLTTSSDGSGSIQFGPNPLRWSTSSVGGGWPGAQLPPAFDSIADAKRVQDLIRQAQRTARTRTEER